MDKIIFNLLQDIQKLL